MTTRCTRQLIQSLKKHKEIDREEESAAMETPDVNNCVFQSILGFQIQTIFPDIYKICKVHSNDQPKQLTDLVHST